LIASELFGHEKGAFTGALQQRAGRFESADGGTIFLDEIGELSPETQVALLRVLQERELERVGSNQPISIDVRVLAATNRDLEAAVSAGKFRQDLFYRINVFPIRIPSLRERKDDIPLLAEYLVERYARRAGKRISHIEKKALELFQAYDWPGNIRELRNALERAVVFFRHSANLADRSALAPEKALMLEPADFPENVRTAGGGAAYSGAGLLSLEEIERSAIAATLEATRYQITRSSEILGISRKTLLEKRKKYGLK